VLELSPTYASAPHNLAVVLLALGRRDESPEGNAAGNAMAECKD